MTLGVNQTAMTAKNVRNNGYFMNYKLKKEDRMGRIWTKKSRVQDPREHSIWS